MDPRAGDLNLNQAPESAAEELPFLEDVLPDLNRVNSSLLTSPWTLQRVFYRIMTTGSIALNPLFSYFLYQSIAKVRDLTLQEFEAEDSDWAFMLFSLLAIYFTAANFLGDPPSVNPIEESEELLKSPIPEEKEGNSCSHALSTLNKVLAIPSFMHFAADNAIAIAGITSNNRSFYLGLGIPFTLFSVIHQQIMGKKDLETHSHRFVHSIRNVHTAESSLLNILKSPLKSLEVTIEAFSNVAYQGIAAGYIADQLAKVFDLQETDPIVMPWIFSVTFLTAYITAFSKVLPAYDEYFNHDFKTLTPLELKKAKVPLTGLLLNGGIALTRAATLGWLTCRFGPSDKTEKILTATGVCLTAFIHPFYVLYKKQKQEIALENRKRAAFFLELIQDEEAGAQAITNHAETLFNKVAKRYETPRLEKTVTFINVSARIGQLLSFIGFVADVLETVNANGYSFPFNFKDTLALGILWGTPIVIIEGRANQEPLVQSATYHRAKYQIGAPTDALAASNFITRTAASFFYSKSQYAKNRLRDALRRLDGGDEPPRDDEAEAEMARLLNRT